jgi:hypothetical protein
MTQSQTYRRVQRIARSLSEARGRTGVVVIRQDGRLYCLRPRETALITEVLVDCADARSLNPQHIDDLLSARFDACLEETAG